MKHLILFGLGAVLALAQKTEFTGAVNMKSATLTPPSGTSLPANCTVPQWFNLTTAAAGRNLYACTGTPGQAGTWTLQSGGDGIGGSPSAGPAGAIQVADSAGGFAESGCTATPGSGELTCPNGLRLGGGASRFAMLEGGTPTVVSPYTHVLYIDSGYHLLRWIYNSTAYTPLLDPGSNGLLKRTALGTTAVAGGSDLPVMVASGVSHAPGAVPDPGESAGTTKYLREDGTWATPSGSGSTSIPFVLELYGTATANSHYFAGMRPGTTSATADCSKWQVLAPFAGTITGATATLANTGSVTGATSGVTIGLCINGTSGTTCDGTSVALFSGITMPSQYNALIPTRVTGLSQALASTDRLSIDLFVPNNNYTGTAAVTIRLVLYITP